MIEPTFDRYGYPTEETLKEIEKWEHTRGFVSLMSFVQEAWNNDYGTWDQHEDIRPWGEEKVVYTTYTISTGGRSGNESLISALQTNQAFWWVCWVQSRRGGHYILEVRHAHS